MITIANINAGTSRMPTRAEATAQPVKPLRPASTAPTIPSAAGRNNMTKGLGSVVPVQSSNYRVAATAKTMQIQVP